MPVERKVQPIVLDSSDGILNKKGPLLGIRLLGKTNSCKDAKMYTGKKKMKKQQ